MDDLAWPVFGFVWLALIGLVAFVVRRVTQDYRALLTPWYPPEIKPVREGVYEVDRDWSGTRWFSYFDGGTWYMCAVEVDRAERYYEAGSTAHNQQKPWRGIQR